MEVFSLRHLKVGEIDLEATAAVVNEAFGRYEIMHGPRTSPEFLTEEAGAGAEFLAIDCDGRLIGTVMVEPAASLHPEDGPLMGSAAGDDALYFGLAAIANGFDGRGLGKYLVQETERIAAARGFSRVVLGTLDEFRLPPFYEALGYQTVHETPFDAGHWNIVVPHVHHAMEKSLPRTLRRATANEAGAVTALINEAYMVEQFFIEGRRTSEEEIAERIGRGDLRVLATPGGRIDGAVSVEFGQVRGYFGMLSVDPRLKGSGLGKLMIRAIEQLAVDAGLQHLDLTVVNLREELYPMYEHLGYQLNGTLPFPEPWKLKRPAHMLTMTRRLPVRSEPRVIPNGLLRATG